MTLPKPEWLSIRPASTEKYSAVKKTVASLGLHTVCTEAHCPNITECWSGGTATFMVLGDKCTRGCKFCSVMKSAKGSGVDPKEPENLAFAIKEWGLSYVVITSVCRDDMPDQGAGHFAECVTAIKNTNKDTMVEVLIPDFRGEESCLKRILDSNPDVVGHNIETVERLSPDIRDRRASYRQSLEVLKMVKELNPKRYTKSAMMLGIGEKEEEVIKSMEDLRSVGVDFLAIGQYLQPSDSHVTVKEYVTPERFDSLKRKAMQMGFRYVAAGPFVRSSYRAGEHFVEAMIKERSVAIC
jgi:lipoyl synthase